MEESSTEEKKKNDEISKWKIPKECIVSNWIVAQNNKQLSDAISIISSSKATKSLTLEEIATEDSCIILQPANANLEGEEKSCTIDINLTSQKISRIGIVSEASVLEFFKESGEYAGTEFAELIDEFDGATVYFTELTFKRPTKQASVKFTRIHNNSRSNMYLYGMRLVVEDGNDSLRNEGKMFDKILTNSHGGNKASGNNGATIIPDSANYNYDGNFMTGMDACLKSFMEKVLIKNEEKANNNEDRSDSTTEKTNENRIVKIKDKEEEYRNMKIYMDNKICDMEERLMRRIDEMDAKTNEKLDRIIKSLDIGNNTN